MATAEEPPLPRAESGRTSRRRWVPLRAMEGAPVLGDEGETGGELDLDWLIVGGGIQGSYLSHYLSRLFEISPERLRVLDSADRPLDAWLRNTGNVGMEYLRSAAVHHLDLPSLSLKRFARRFAGSYREPHFIPPYGRPLLSLFNDHAAEVIARNGLDRLRLAGRARELHARPGGYEVEFDGPTGPQRLSSANVVLAIGMDDGTCWPDWARRLKGSGARVYHVLDRDFKRQELAPWRRAIVYGGGLSGVQIAAALSERAPGGVSLLAGHEMGVHLFDSEPSWQGENFMSSFAAERDPARRRAIIQRERHRGSVTPEAQGELDRLVESGRLAFAVSPGGEVEVTRSGEGFELEAAGRRLQGDLLILATGYDTVRPGGEWIDRAVERLSLPCAPCGYPVVRPDLQWRRGLFVAGPLAELELGPVARNISGAHRAASRLDYYQPGGLRRRESRRVERG